VTERRIFEHLAAHILEPVCFDRSDSEHDLVRDDIVTIFENLDRKDMRTATRDDFQRLCESSASQSRIVGLARFRHARRPAHGLV
jgi:hypothetical protein